VYDLLLAIEAGMQGEPASVLLVADLLALSEAEVVELAQSARAAGLVEWDRETPSRRVLSLTPEGERLLAGVASAHISELRADSARVARILGSLGGRSIPIPPAAEASSEPEGARTSDPGVQRSRAARRAAEGLLVGAVLFIASAVGAHLFARGWLSVGVATGTAVAAVILRGRVAAISVAVGATLGAWFSMPGGTHAGLAAAIYASVIVGEALAAREMWVRIGGFISLRDISSVLSLSGISVVSSLLAASIAVPLLRMTLPGEISSLSLAWGQWVLSNLAGILVVSACAMVWIAGWTERPRGRAFEAVALCVALPLLARIVLVGKVPHPSLLLPVLLWAAVRLRRHGSVLAVLVVAVVGSVGMYGLIGGVPASTFGETLVFQGATAAMAATLLLLSATLDAKDSSETRFRSLIESAPDAVIVVDGVGTIVLVNRLAETMFGYDRDDLTGLEIGVLIPESFRMPHAAHMKKYFDSPRPRHWSEGMELLARRSDGSVFPVDVALASVEAEDGPLAMAFVRDITERLRVDKERRAIELRLSERDPASDPI
jgi:PAS domain S-box-containing protein